MWLESFLIILIMHVHLLWSIILICLFASDIENHEVLFFLQF